MFLVVTDQFSDAKSGDVITKNNVEEGVLLGDLLGTRGSRRCTGRNNSNDSSPSGYVGSMVTGDVIPDVYH